MNFNYYCINGAAACEINLSHFPISALINAHHQQSHNLFMILSSVIYVLHFGVAVSIHCLLMRRNLLLKCLELEKMSLSIKKLTKTESFIQHLYVNYINQALKMRLLVVS